MALKVTSGKRKANKASLKGVFLVEVLGPVEAVGADLVEGTAMLLLEVATGAK